MKATAWRTLRLFRSIENVSQEFTNRHKLQNDIPAMTSRALSPDPVSEPKSWKKFNFWKALGFAICSSGSVSLSQFLMHNSTKPR